LFLTQIERAIMAHLNSERIQPVKDSWNLSMTKPNFILICLASTVSLALGTPQPTSMTRGKMPFQPGAPVSRNQHVFQEDDQAAQNENEGDTQTDEDSYDVFYDQLANDGQWYYDDSYGYVFQPAAATSSSDWRPYSDGHWEDTDRGWYWDSNENFGWATYHYGRWVLIDGEGWVWVPGSEWAPAWVSWRDSDDYVGWAPLPPECGNVSVGISIGGWSDSYWGVGPSWYCFLPYNHWYSHSYVGAFAPFSQNVTIINRTRNVTNIYNNNTIINNYGPRAQQIALRTNRQPTRYNINYVAQRNGFKTAVNGRQLNVVAPKARLKPVAAKAPTVAKTLTNPQINKGWKNVNAAEAAKLKTHFTQQNPVPHNLPKAATTGLVKPTILKKPVAGTNNPAGGNKGAANNTVGGNKGAGNGVLANQNPVTNTAQEKNKVSGNNVGGSNNATGQKGAKNLKAFSSPTNGPKKGVQGTGGGSGANNNVAHGNGAGSNQLKSFKATNTSHGTGTGAGNQSSQKTLKKSTNTTSGTVYQPKPTYQKPKTTYQQPKASYQPKPTYHPTTSHAAPTYHPSSGASYHPSGGGNPHPSGGGNYHASGGGGNKPAAGGGNNNKDKEKKKK
jgi:hypothetical protein